jgi:hypothetical protein
LLFGRVGLFPIARLAAEASTTPTQSINVPRAASPARTVEAPPASGVHSVL